MNILEKDIEDVICHTLGLKNGIELLFNRGLHSVIGYDIFFRQLHLYEYGTADLVGIKFCPYERILSVGVFELKRQSVNIDTLLQASSYITAISDYIENFLGLKTISFTTEYELILIGSCIETKGSFSYLPSIFRDKLKVYSVSIDLEKGIVFKRETGYKLSSRNLEPFSSSERIRSIKSYISDKIRKKVELSE